MDSLFYFMIEEPVQVQCITKDFVQNVRRVASVSVRVPALSRILLSAAEDSCVTVAPKVTKVQVF